MKTLQAGNLDIKADNTLVATISIGAGMADNKWYTYSKEVSLPGGEFTLRALL